jgi:tetratricopeptide (TPR) repeat protein
MKRGFFAFLLTISFVAFGSAESAAGLASPSTEAVVLVAGGDAAFSSRTVDKGAVEAAALFEKAISKDPALVDAYWKASRAYHWAADHALKKSDKVLWFENGMERARQGLEKNPNSVECHFWLGANMGSYGESKGVLKSLGLVKPIRQAMEKIILINDKYQSGGAYRVLNVVDYKVPGFAGGNKKRALERLTKAVEIDPANAFNHFYLAEFFDLMDNPYKAKEHLSTLLSLTPTSDVDLQDLQMIQARARKLLKRVEKKS